jgi:hypothetical protein
MATVTSNTNFAMLGARAAIAGGLLHIEQQVIALEQAIAENPGLAFDLAKTLIESACKSITTERGGRVEKNDEMSDLFRKVKGAVPFLPPASAGERGARKSLEQTLNGLNTALQGVCELRNACGFASHGSDGPRPAMERVQVLLAVQAADTIVGFLYSAHAADLARLPVARLEFDDNPDFNEWIDNQSKMVQVLNLPPYRPSEVLFNVDQEAYRDLLAQYGDEDEPAVGNDDVTPGEGNKAIQ